MSRLLLIEPQTIVREAIRRFLSQDHEIHAAEHWTAEELRDFDGVIVDLEALEAKGESVSGLSEALAAAKVPVLWLAGTPPDPLERGKFRTLGKPLEREPLKNALHDLISEDSGAEAPSRTQPAIIELTEVVEAGSELDEDEKTKE